MSYFEGEIKLARCTENIQLLLKIFDQKGLDISKFTVIRMENQGTHFGGLVKTFAARPGSEVCAASNSNYCASMNGWHFHVIAIAEGRVYDFNYLTKDTPPTIKEYFTNMLTIKFPIPTFSTLQVYDHAKSVRALKSYVAKVYDPVDFILEKNPEYLQRNLLELLEELNGSRLD